MATKGMIDCLNETITNSTLTANNISSQIIVLDDNWFEFVTVDAENHLLDLVHQVLTLINNWRMTHRNSIMPGLMNLMGCHPSQADKLAQIINSTKGIILSEYKRWISRIPEGIESIDNLNPLLIKIRDKMIEIDSSIKTVVESIIE